MRSNLMIQDYLSLVEQTEGKNYILNRLKQTSYNFLPEFGKLSLNDFSYTNKQIITQSDDIYQYGLKSQKEYGGEIVFELNDKYEIEGISIEEGYHIDPLIMLSRAIVKVNHILDLLDKFTFEYFLKVNKRGNII